MRFKLETLVDITETNARKEDDPVAYKQHQNYLTIMQTLSLRTNIVLVSTNIESVNVTGKFDKSFKGKQKVWTIIFDLDRPDAAQLSDFQSDLHFVPFIHNLEETVKFKRSAFQLQENDEINTIISSI